MLERCVNFACEIIGKLHFECMQFNFMQIALLATLFLAPLTAVAGVQVVNYRMAFFADTIGHSVFAGAALGILLSGASAPVWSMPLFAVLIGIGVLALKNYAKQSSDTLIGVFFAFAVSLGLLLVSRIPNLAKLSQQFIFGDILTVSAQDILLLLLLDIIYAVFICCKYNSMLLAVIDEDLYKVKYRNAVWSDYLHTALLALIVIFTVRIAGVLLAGALLIVPAATARNLVRHSGSMFLCSILLGVISGIAGLLIAAQDWANLPAGAAIVMTNCIFFAISLPIKRVLGSR